MNVSQRDEILVSPVRIKKFWDAHASLSVRLHEELLNMHFSY
jgi:hypothetical protein